MTSGSCRSALRSACANDRVSTETSRWLTIDRLSRWRNSIGSSTVMTCAQRVLLMWSISAASVVLLPLPVVPVTRTSPRSSSAIVFRTCGRPSSSIVRICIGMTRRTRPIVPRCWKTLQRKRPEPGHAVGEVDFLAVLELLALLRGHHRGAPSPTTSSWSSRLSSVAGISVAAHPHHRVAADLQVQVRGAALDGDLQQIVDVHCRAVLPIHDIGGSRDAR